MDTSEFDKSKIFAIEGMNHFIPQGIFIKSILTRNTGNVNAVFIDSGQQITEKFSRFDQLIQIVEGKADVQIDDDWFMLTSGESIIIPAQTQNTIKANERSKLISTIIKSGYE